ncbi:MAG TPA: PIN domain-containing protein [Wenzhouxiangellaceae bacterium]|nr:PIN domain-containing protein [Wenzhouxiangellaceae bacterium]HMB39435.1 PIN domain-containing protein [Wenzhouxiangellaceae bacterium]
MTPDEVCEQIGEWSERGNVWMPVPGDRFGILFTQLLKSSQASGNLVSDAYLGALALEHGLSVVSTDADFRRFANVKWLNPLEAV